MNDISKKILVLNRIRAINITDAEILISVDKKETLFPMREVEKVD